MAAWHFTKKNKNIDWSLNPGDMLGSLANCNEAMLAVLMDIRAQLFKLNAVFSCVNFVRIPRVLDQIQRNTKKAKRKKKV